MDYLLLNIIHQSYLKTFPIGVWIDCIRFEYMYGSRTLVEEIYKASLVCLEPDLIMVMTEEFEKLKDEFEYVLYCSMNLNCSKV